MFYHKILIVCIVPLTLTFLPTTFSRNFQESGNNNNNTDDSVKWLKYENTINFSHQDAAGLEVGIKFLIARAEYMDGMIPGKHRYGMDLRHPPWMEFTFNGQDQKAYDFEVLTYPHGVLTWVKVSNASNLPPNRFRAGLAPITGEDLYVCRVTHDAKHLVTGKVSVKSANCIYPLYGVKTSKIFEILVDTRAANVTPTTSPISRNYSKAFDHLESTESKNSSSLQSLWYILPVVFVVVLLSTSLISYLWYKRRKFNLFGFTTMRTSDWNLNDDVSL